MANKGKANSIICGGKACFYLSLFLFLIFFVAFQPQGGEAMAATMLSLCNSGLLHGGSSYSSLFHGVKLRERRIVQSITPHGCPMRKSFLVLAATEGSTKSSKSEESIPSWARPDSDEPPPWARVEGRNYSSSSKPSLEIPFFVYLLASAVTAIAAIGSIFEYVNQKPVFGLLYPDSIFYAPLLGFFVFTGVPSSAFLWFKSVEAANKEAEEQDRRDGYL